MVIWMWQEQRRALLAHEVWPHALIVDLRYVHHMVDLHMKMHRLLTAREARRAGGEDGLLQRSGGLVNSAMAPLTQVDFSLLSRFHSVEQRLVSPEIQACPWLLDRVDV